VREKLQSDGWSNVIISRNGKYIEVTGSLNGRAGQRCDRGYYERASR